MAEFLIEPTKDGLVDVTKDRRAFAYDLEDVERAKRYIVSRGDFDPNTDTVVFVEPDGYRTTLRM